MGARYLVVLIMVALLVIVDQAIVQPLLIRLDRYAPAINLSGRQRMLSQKLTKAALALERSHSASEKNRSRQELQGTLDQWVNAHVALRDGDTMRGVHRIESREIQEQWKQLEPHFVAMSEAARRVIDDNLGNELSASGKNSVVTILDHEASFLEIMDAIVKAMEVEANREVQWLRAFALAIAATIVTLLVGLGWFVVRPATRTIRGQVDELETRVDLRTAELASALKSLQHETHEREIVESNNKRLAAQLAHADRVESIGHLAAGLAHELNHPLGAIANYSEACDVLLGRTSQSDHDKLRNFIVRIRDASLRAGQIVRRMRNFVQPGTNASSLVDMRVLIDEIIALCQPEIDRHQVELSIELELLAANVTGDAIQIQQVLVNLVQNALQAMADIPAANRKLLLRTSYVADSIQIDVVDSGPGIDTRDAETVFEPFHTTKTDGLGIGLSICRSIVENHHGTIWADSSPDQGTSISFTLPLAPPHAACLAEPADSLCS